MNMVLSLVTTLMSKVKCDDKPLMTKVKHDDLGRTLDVDIEAIGTHWNTKWVQMTHSVVICGLIGS